MPRNVSVSITADTGGFTAGMAKVASSARAAGSSVKASFDKNLGGIGKNSQHFDRIGSSLVKIGAVGAIGLGLSAKAAIDWESAWAGVTKTTSGSAQQMGVLEGQLRGLARTLPESHTQIAAVAEAAGQLGIQRDSIAQFTKTMVQLGDTTNLTSDEAATKLAQFGNIMGTLNGPANQVNDNISRLGATIVGLGNDGASTEAQIVNMGLRLAGAGKAVGLTSQEVLGFSSAIASTGIEVEAGGTAMSQVFIKLDQAVRQGGTGLKTLASTAGQTSAQFKQSFQTDAAGATTAFIQGLGKIQAKGGDVTAVLSKLGITGARQTDVLRRLASSGDLVAKSLQNSSTQYDRNNALVDEAAKRYATTESRVKIAFNQIKDASIGVGQQLLPVFAQVATVVGQAATAFGQLSGPAKSAAVAIGLTVATVGLLGGGVIKGVTALAQLSAAFKAAGIASSVASRGFKLAGLSIPLIGIGLFAITEAISHFAAQSTTASEVASTFAQSMTTVEGNVTRATAAINANVRESAVQSLQQTGAFDQAKALGLGLGTVTDAALGNKDAIAQVNTVLGQYIHLSPQASKADNAKMVAAQSLAKILGGVATAEIDAVAAEQDRRAAMEGVAAAGKASADASRGVASALTDLTVKSSASAQQTAALASSLFKSGDAAQNAAAVHSSYAAAIDDANKGIEANGKHLNKANTALSDNTAKGRANLTLLGNLSTTGKAYVQSLVAQGAGQKRVTAATRAVRSEFIQQARAAGLSAGAAAKLANAYGLIPKRISIKFDAIGLAIQQAKVEKFRAALTKLPAKQQSRIEAIYESKGPKAALRELNRLNGITAKPKVKPQTDPVKPPKMPKIPTLKIGTKIENTGERDYRPPKLKPITQQVKIKFGGNTGERDGASAAGRQKTVSIPSKIETPKSPKIPQPKGIKIPAKIDTPKAPKVPAGKTLRIKSKVDTPKAPKVPQPKTITIKVKVGKVPSIKVPQPKTVQIKTSGNTSGAAKVKSAIAAVKAKTVKVSTTGNPAGANKVKSAIAAVKAKSVRVTATASYGQVNSARSAIAGIHGKSVNVNVTTTHTNITITKTVKKAGGGYIDGPGTETSDSIPAWLSKGEVVIKAASVRSIGLERLLYANAMGQLPKFKEGGHVGLGFAKGGKVPAAPKNLDAAILKILALQYQADNAKSVAELTRVNKALAAATKKLSDSQTSMAESIKGLSSSLIEPYRTKSKDIDDWLEAMKEGTSDLTAFRDNVKKLRKLGLSETLIKQISEQGAVAGNELAEQILQGGKGLADSLDLANKRLEEAAKKAGGAATIVKGYAAGGPIAGSGTGTSDSVTVRASKGEYLVNAQATAENRSALDAINFGRRVIDHRFVPHFAYGGMVQQSREVREVKAGDVIIKDSQFGASADQVAAKIAARQRDSQIMAGLRVHI